MNDLLKTLASEQLKEIKIVNLQKEEILFNEGDLCECVGIVLDGGIEITSYSYTGNEIIFNRLTPGMVFGNNLVFSSDPHYKGSVIVKKPAKVGLIYKKSLISILKSNDEFMILYLQYQSDTAKQLNAKIKLLSLSNAEERFLYYLHSQGGQINYDSVTELANRISLQRETVSRLITKLVNEKKIVKTKTTIKLIE